MYVKILDMDMYIVYYRYKIDRYFKRENREIFFLLILKEKLKC